jgi:glycosyltransferase involved in cell wall biosynthesis
LIVSALFPPEPVVSARTSADLARNLYERGHQVQVIAPYPSRPGGRRYPGYPRRLYHPEASPSGYKITRCLSATSTHSTLLSRLWENLTFGLVAALRVLWIRPKPQVIYANTWPLLAQGLLVLAANLRRISLVLNVQDLYPESLAVQGHLSSNSFIYRLLLGLDGWIACNSQVVILASESFIPAYCQRRRVSSETVHVVHNWIDIDQLLPEIERAETTDHLIRLRMGIPANAFLLVYGGNVGAAAGLEHIIRVVASIEPSDTLNLLIAGEGSQLDECRQLGVELGLSNLTFLCPWLPDDTAGVLSCADLLLLPTQGDQSLVSLPSKLLSYLLAARLILAIARPESELAAVIKNAGCGWVVPPNDPQALAAVIRLAMLTPLEERRELGAAGRSYALAHFTCQANLPKLVALIESFERKSNLHHSKI